VTAGRRDAATGLPERWGLWLVLHRYAVLAAAAVVLVALALAWHWLGGPIENLFNLPGTETQQAADLLQSRFPAQAGDTARIVFFDSGGMKEPETQQRVTDVLAHAKQLPNVTGVGTPFTGNAGGVSADGKTAFAGVQYDHHAREIPDSSVHALFALVDGSGGNGLRIEAGGAVVEQHESQPDRSEIYGFVAAGIILLIAFGSVVAMGLPLVTAITGLVVGLAIMGLLGHVLDLPSFAPDFVAMIGLGVGIDYALLIVTRFRESLAEGHSPREAVAISVATAGRSVAFAGSAVAIAMLGFLTNGIPFITALGIVGAVVVLAAVIVAWTVLPALLGVVGHGIDRWSIGGAKHSEHNPTEGIWYRMAELIQARPRPWCVVAVIALILLALPVTRMQLGAADAGNGPPSLHSRRAYDLLSAGFGPGFNGPLTVVLDVKGTQSSPAGVAGTVRSALLATPGVLQVTAPTADPAGDAATMTVVPHTSPQDAATQRLVHDLRRNVLPAAVAGTGSHTYVAGTVAGYIDIGDRISARLPWFFLAILGLSFLMLMTVFRSVPVALTAVVMNLLSIGAAYGVLVAVFQWGWLGGLVGVRRGPIESYLPMMLFAVVFGLSMDYEVFLISRIREEYDRSGDNAEAVARGLAATGRVIMAGASIMVVVFLSFVLVDKRVIKEFGLGLAAAVIVDATIVRLALVPATMELLGRANWWMPRWLDRILPRVDVEGESSDLPSPAPALPASSLE
jgi:RND superfamily putative drug exporter